VRSTGREAVTVTGADRVDDDRRDAVEVGDRRGEPMRVRGVPENTRRSWDNWGGALVEE
jgi:hypothetical protein